MSEFTAEPGWLQRQIKNVEREVSQWPNSMKTAAGIDPETNPHPLQAELDRTKAEIGDWRETAQELRRLCGCRSSEDGPRLLDDIMGYVRTVTADRDRLREALVAVSNIAARQLSEPVPAHGNGDTVALVGICTAAESALSAPTEPKPEDLACGVCLGRGCTKCGKPPQEVPSVPRMPKPEAPKCEWCNMTGTGISVTTVNGWHMVKTAGSDDVLRVKCGTGMAQ